MIADLKAEAADYRLLAAKFKLKARAARIAVRKAFFSGLERRYLLLAQINEQEADKLRTEDEVHSLAKVYGTDPTG